MTDNGVLTGEDVDVLVEWLFVLTAGPAVAFMLFWKEPAWWMGLSAGLLGLFVTAAYRIGRIAERRIIRARIAALNDDVLDALVKPDQL